MTAPAGAQVSSKRGGSDTEPTATAAAPVTVNPSGEVGVATTSPAAGVKKDIADPAKRAGTGSEACSPASLGQIRYNPTNGYVEICTP